MPRSRLTSLASFLPALALIPTTAYADVPSLDESSTPRSRLAVSFGAATPTGELGVEYTQSVHRYLELGLGGGIGITGPQAAFMPRLRLGRGSSAMTLGAGISGGYYDEPRLVSFCFSDRGEKCADNTTKTTAVWANAELGMQSTYASGWTVHFYLGVGKALAHGKCRNGNCDDVDGMTMPYVGLAIGHTL